MNHATRDTGKSSRFSLKPNSEAFWHVDSPGKMKADDYGCGQADQTPATTHPGWSFKSLISLHSPVRTILYVRAKGVAGLTFGIRTPQNT